MADVSHRPGLRPTRRTVLRAAAAGVALPAIGGRASARETRTVVDLDGVGPENLAVDDDGDVYLTMNPTGEVRRLDAEDARETGLTLDDTSLVATLPARGGFTLGIVEVEGDLYVALPAPVASHRGIWRLPVDGPTPAGPFAPIPDSGLINGVLHDPARDRLLVTDSFLGRIYRVDLPGGAVDVWADEALLDPTGFIGANGLAMDARGDVHVAHLDEGRLVRFPVGPNGSAGSPEVVVEDPALVGADGLDFHRGRTPYVAVNGQDRVVRVAPSGRLHVVVDASDGLDFPADVAFGAGPTSGRLFVANFGLNPATFAIDGDPSLVLAHP